MFKCVTFNVQTLRREGRLLDILQRRTHLFTLPGQTKSEFTDFRGVATAIRENTFLPANVRRIYTPLAPLAGRGGALKLVRGDAAFLIMSLYLPPSPSNLREKQLSEKIWKWARRVLDETPSRVVPVLWQDANGHISQTPWPEQIGKYSSKKTTFNGQCLGELLRDHHLRAANTYFPVEAIFFGPFSNTQIDFACLPAAVHFHRCCALHHGDRLQLAAAPSASMGQEQAYTKLM